MPQSVPEMLDIRCARGPVLGLTPTEWPGSCVHMDTSNMR